MSTEKRSIAEKTAQLDELVSWFDSDAFELEQALDKFKEAEKLAAEIEKDLLALKNEVNVIKKKFDEA
ncbi:MAG TPA: exodeoxyribonuclease VII small subunit [Verrucomicrobiae bacterium]|jgi:exodeoxyribonuclease VII small subunit|nr:exodeoxyribonuclease VII small subunit [Verrucomicrobiae bacterium]